MRPSPTMHSTKRNSKRSSTDGKSRCENNENMTHNKNRLHNEIMHRSIILAHIQTETVKRILRSMMMMMKMRVTLPVHIQQGVTIAHCVSGYSQ